MPAAATPAAVRRLSAAFSHLRPSPSASAHGALWDASSAPGIALLEHVNLYVGDTEGDRKHASNLHFLCISHLCSIEKIFIFQEKSWSPGC